MKPIKEKSCGIVIYRSTDEGQKFLLLHYPSGHWDFPKGHVEKGEDERQTASREVQEETGIIEFKFQENFRERMEYAYQREGKLYLKEVIFFLAETKTEEIKISHEHQNHIWLSYEKALEQLTFENAKEILKKAQQFLESPVQ